MAVREIYYSERLDESTNTSPGPATTHDTVDYTATAGVKYLIMWSAMCNLNSTTAHFEASLTDGIATVTNKIRPHDTVNYHSVFAMIFNDYATGGGPYTFAVEHQPSASGLTSKMRESRLLVIETLPDDEIYQDSTPKTTSSTSFEPQGSVTLNPASSEDYIIIAMGMVDISVSSRPITVQMYDGTTGYREMKFRMLSDAERHGYAAVFRLTGITSSTTVSIRIKVDDGGDVGTIRDVVIFAMPLSSFENTYYVEELTRQVILSDTYVTELSQTETPNAADHIILASAIVDTNSNASQTDHIFTDGGTTKINGIVEPNTGAGNADASFFFCGRETYAASSRTWTFQQKKIGGPFHVAGMDDMAIAVIEDGVTVVVPTVKILGGKILGGTIL